MSVARDFRILWQFARGSGKGEHAARLEQFYSSQAEDYDAFRERLLPGRQELISSLPIVEGSCVLDFGGGTGFNLDFLSEKKHRLLSGWTIVDLSRSLLRVASRRASENNWAHVECHEHDVCTYGPDRPPDIVLFSYSLTMIPSWMDAIDHAFEILKPGGHVAVVDFTVSRKYPPRELARHGAFTRTFWPLWFSWDNVFLNADHLPYLMRRFITVELREDMTRLPYLPGSRVPYFLYVGQKPDVLVTA